MSAGIRQLAKEAANYLADQPLTRQAFRGVLNNLQNVFLSNPQFTPKWAKSILPRIASQTTDSSRRYAFPYLFLQNRPVTYVFWQQIRRNLLMERFKHIKIQHTPSLPRRTYVDKPNPPKGNARSGGNKQHAQIKGNGKIQIIVQRIREGARIWIKWGGIGLGSLGTIAAGLYVACEKYPEVELCDFIRKKLDIKKKQQ
ncbi:MAG: hypothetical protein JSS10_02045 [Verrucomicrobia bacterium]|nr:hypothetical protein [Verrucomicrobiota bacterium]